MHVIGEVRVRTEEQVRDGVSLATQRGKINADVLVKDWTLMKIIADEGMRAKSLNRPGLQELMALVEGCRVQTVIVC